MSPVCSVPHKFVEVVCPDWVRGDQSVRVSLPTSKKEGGV